MRRPHVFERSAPRAGRDAYSEPDSRAVAARTLAAQLGNMIDRAEAAGLATTLAHLKRARDEAEKIAIG